MRSEHVAVHRRGDVATLVDEDADSAFRLDEVAATIAERLAAPTTLGTVCDRVGAEFEVDAERCAAEVERFVGELADRGYVEPYGASPTETVLRRRYLDLLVRALVNLIYPEHEVRLHHLERQGPEPERTDTSRKLRDIRYSHAEELADLIARKHDGRIWEGKVTRYSHTMVGVRRLENLERCAARVFADGVPGDFLEAGVCQGGAAIFLRALQVAYDEPWRRTWVADSFEGLPVPEHPIDADYDFSETHQPWLAADLETVQANFRTYDLLSDAVRFLPGWFRDTLPAAPVEQLAILRIDADLYASTRDVLVALYDRVAPGGFVVVDDYWTFDPCRTAVDEFLAEQGVAPALRRIDQDATYWRKTE